MSGCIFIPSLLKALLAYTAAAILLALILAALPAHADVQGINSQAGSDLPMGAGGGDPFMWLTPAGSVKIGTGAAGNMLEVNGLAQMDGNATVGGTLGVTGATTLSSLTVNGLTGTNTLNIGGIGPLDGDSASTLNNLRDLGSNGENTACGNGYALTKSGPDSFTCVAVSEIKNVGQVTLPDCPNGLAWNGTSSTFTCLSPASEYWTLSGSGYLYNNSGTNVGIGTAAPTQPLTVAGAGWLTGGLFFGGNFADANDLYLGDAGDGMGSAILRVGSGGKPINDKNFEFNANGQFQVLNGGATFNGDVSIGTTTTATANLEVNNGSLGASDYCINGIGCSRVPVPKNFSCPSGQQMTGFDSSGNPVCTAGSPPVPNAQQLYLATYSYIDPNTWNNDLYNGLYVVGLGGPVADGIWAACNISNPADEGRIGTIGNAVACMDNTCTGHFGKYPTLAETNGFCAQGDANPLCASHMIMNINCEYVQ